MPDQARSASTQLRHDVVLWLNHHNFEELPDALEYYLVNPDSDLKADLYYPDLLDQSGMNIHISPFAIRTLLNLLEWAVFSGQIVRVSKPI